MFDAVLLFRDALYGALVIVGAALAQISSAGIALALWLSGLGIATALTSHPVALSLAVTLAGALFFGLGGARARVPGDATIGVTYALAAALGILLIAKAATGEAHDLFLQGNVLGITRTDTLVLH